jgi:hypothetical protein
MLTVIHRPGGYPHNKILTGGPDAGGRWPDPVAANRADNVTDVEATAVAVPNAAAMAALVASLTEADALLVGYPHGANPSDRFRVVSINTLRGQLGLVADKENPPLGIYIAPDGERLIARANENFAFSAIKLFDLDTKTGRTYPDDWTKRQPADWWRALVSIEPSLDGVERLYLGSNSARFLGPDGRPIYSHKASQIHCFVWSEGFPPSHEWVNDLKAKSFAAGQYQPRTKRKNHSDELVPTTPAPVFDALAATTSMHASYDGTPALRRDAAEAGASVAPPRVEAVPGRLWRHSDIVEATPEQLEQASRISGQQIVTRTAADGSTRHELASVVEDLELDLWIDFTGGGGATLAEFWEEHEHADPKQLTVRCHVPEEIRVGASPDNAFLGIRRDGTPFLRDRNGDMHLPSQRARTQYRFRGVEVQTQPRPAAQQARGPADPVPDATPALPPPAVPPRVGDDHPVLWQLERPDPLLWICAGTGNHKTTAAAEYVRRMLAQGFFVVYLTSSRKAMLDFDTELRRTTGQSADDLGLKLLMSHAPGDLGDDDAEGTSGASWSFADYGGIVSHFWALHRRGHTEVFYAWVRRMAELRLAQQGDPAYNTEKFREKVTDRECAFLDKRVVWVVDEAYDGFEALKRELTIDRRWFGSWHRGFQKKGVTGVDRCRARKQGFDACESCRLQRDALVAKPIPKYHTSEFDLPARPDPDRQSSQVPVSAERAFRLEERLVEVARDDERGFVWSWEQLPEGHTAQTLGHSRLRETAGQYPLRLFAQQPPVPGDPPLDHEQILTNLWRASYSPLVCQSFPTDQGRIFNPRELLLQQRAHAAFGSVMPPGGSATPEQAAPPAPREPKFPTYACEVRRATLPDMLPLLFMALTGHRVRFLSASTAPWMQRMVGAVWAAEPTLVELPGVAKRMDEALVLDLSFRVTVPMIREGVKLLDPNDRALIFAALKSQMDDMSGHLKPEDGYVLFKEGRDCSEFSAAHLQGRNCRALLTYVNSAIGRAANLGEHRLMIIDQQTHSPGHGLFVDHAFDAGVARKELAAARVARLVNPLGRILRPNTDGEPSPMRRAYLVHNPDALWIDGARIVQPMPAEALKAVAGRVEPGQTHYRRILSPKNALWAMQQAVAFLRDGALPPAEEPTVAKRNQTPGRRGPAEGEASKRSRRRAETLDRLEALRREGIKWHPARQTNGVQYPIRQFFTTEERAQLKLFYESGDPLVLLE